MRAIRRILLVWGVLAFGMVIVIAITDYRRSDRVETGQVQHYEPGSPEWERWHHEDVANAIAALSNREEIVSKPEPPGPRGRTWYEKTYRTKRFKEKFMDRKRTYAKAGGLGILLLVTGLAIPREKKRS